MTPGVILVQLHTTEDGIDAPAVMMKACPRRYLPVYSDGLGVSSLRKCSHPWRVLESAAVAG